VKEVGHVQGEEYVVANKSTVNQLVNSGSDWLMSKKSVDLPIKYRGKITDCRGVRDSGKSVRAMSESMHSKINTIGTVFVVEMVYLRHSVIEIRMFKY
jgi:hypothetical protein